MRNLLLLGLLAGALSATSLCAQPAKVHRIGVVANTVPLAQLASGVNQHAGLRVIAEGLRQRGWIDGKNVQLVWRTAENRWERWPEIIGELVQMPVDVLLVFDPRAAEVAIAKTRTIPIVCATFGRLLDSQLVASLARPGANLTGITMDDMRELNGKRLALLKAAAPKVTRVAFLVQQAPGIGPHPGFSAETLAAAKSLGITVFTTIIERPDQLEAKFSEAARKGANGVIASNDGIMFYPENQRLIHEQAIRHRVPVMYQALGSAQSGGLMSYGVGEFEIYDGGARLVDRILRGAKPAEMPIERPSQFEFIVNLKAAKAIGLTIPGPVLAEATRVIN